MQASFIDSSESKETPDIHNIACQILVDLPTLTSLQHEQQQQQQQQST